MGSKRNPPLEWHPHCEPHLGPGLVDGVVRVEAAVGEDVQPGAVVRVVEPGVDQLERDTDPMWFPCSPHVRHRAEAVRSDAHRIRCTR